MEKIRGLNFLQKPAVILVVDDHRMTRQLSRKSLEQEGYTVLEADSGEACLEIFPTAKPDMVLLDGLMPGMDGFTCCAKLHTLYGEDCPPVLMVTALDDRESVHRAFEVGAIDFIAKPIQWQVLRRRVQRLLETHWAMLELKTQAERESLRRMVAFLDAMPVGVAVLEGNGNTYYCNQRAKDLFGNCQIFCKFQQTSQMRADDVNTSIYLAGTNLAYPQWQSPSIRALKGESCSVDNMEIHRDGKVIPLEVWGTPILDLAGNISHAIIAFQDITERKQIEVERRNFTNQLEAKNFALREMNQLKDEFLKNISHELRTPLNGITGCLQILKDDLYDDEEEQQELIQEANNSALHLISLIDDVLDLSVLEAGQLSLDLQEIDLGNCLQEAISLKQPRIQQKNLQFNVNLSLEPIKVKANFRKLKQVFFNILDNAIKFTASGSITISTKIQIQDHTDCGKNPLALATIQDTGIGIEPEKVKKIFEPFVMADGSTTRSYAGNGVGLSIAHKLITLMGGSIKIASSGKNQGTTVTVTLPIIK
ncbi:MAG: response regulator [Spirulinaceae cyanobacterium]